LKASIDYHAAEKYIFRGQVPDPAKRGTPPKAKPSRTRFSHKMLAQDPISVPGGTVRIADTSNFPVSKTVAAAHVVLRPHALRELHWHPNADEWTFFIRGHARMTIFAAEGRARTFDYHPGDIGIVPKNMAHYIENIGADGEELEFLEIFRAPKFEDFSLDQWLAVTPPQMVLEHLNLADKSEEEKSKFLKALNATKVPLKADVSE
jgi:oxalate decarboxylase family bicupin protein